MNPDIADLAREAREFAQNNLDSLARPAISGASLPDSAFERLYAFGFRLLASSQHEQALSVFAFLFAQRPTEPRVLSGFGHSLLGLGDIGQAALMHSLAHAAEPDNPAHVLAIAEDLIAMEAPMADEMLRAAEVLAQGQPSHAGVARRAQALRGLLQQGRP